MKKWTILMIACVLGAAFISYKSFKPKTINISFEHAIWTLNK